jgi:endoglucanase
MTQIHPPLGSTARTHDCQDLRSNNVGSGYTTPLVLVFAGCVVGCVAGCSATGTDAPYTGSPGPTQSAPTNEVTSSDAVSPVSSTDESTQAPTVPAGAWDEGLSMGPNGPIPSIVVDQFGYRPNDPKFAILRDPRVGFDEASEFTPGSKVHVVDSATSKAVKTAAPSAWGNGEVDDLSGDATWSFDFSDLTTPGKYFVYDEQTGRRSPEFEIKDDVYRQVLRHALRTFFYQRAGFEKTAEFAGTEWADGASHLGPEQDAEARSWLDQENAATAKDLSGGWYDAGDYNKYTTWHSRYIINLLRTFAFYPQAFGDDFGIPESGNAIPDILDEVKFGVEWLTRAQNEDGSLVCVQGLATATPPSDASNPSYYGPPSTAATLSGAAAFAYAARIFGARSEAAFVDLAADLRARAVRAWEWADANPAVTYYNNDESKQEGSEGLAAGQQEVDDSSRLALKVEAAAYLFQQTDDATYRDFFDANYITVTPNYLSHWQVDRHEAVLDYASQPGATPSVAEDIRSTFADMFLGNGGFLKAASNNEDPYRSAIETYTWGSNQSKAAVGRLLLLNGEYEVDSATVEASNAAATDYVHYVHGVNPLGLVYLTNMASAGAEHSAKTLYHSWFSYTSDEWSEVSATTPGPAPGFLVGGPNPMYTLDGCCTDGSECYGSGDFDFCALALNPPLQQPDSKSYLQFNLGWPANSWAVTENSNGYQTQYIRVLAAFVQ